VSPRVCLTKGVHARTRVRFRSKGTTYWTQQVTDFYKTYAGDRDINVDEILEQMRNGLTLEQIHKYPFMRRRSQANSAGSKPSENTTKSKE